MGLVEGIWGYCYITCDRPNCTKRMDSGRCETLATVAKLCGWKKRGEHWICPECVKKEEEKRRLKSGRKSR